MSNSAEASNDAPTVPEVETIFHSAKLLHQHSPTPAARLNPSRGSSPSFSESPPIEFGVRLTGPPIPVHQLSIGPERSTMMSVRDFMNSPAEDSAAAVVHKGETYSGL